MPQPDSLRRELEPIERASVDELRALQLDRLRWSLGHAYDNVPHYRAAFDVAAVHPDDCKELSDLAPLPVHQQGRPARQLPVRPVRGAQGAGVAGARLVRDDRPGHGGRVHRGRSGRVGDGDGAVDPRGGRAARAPGARGVRVRAVHRRARRALRGGEAGLHGRAGLRGDDRAAGDADPGLPAGHHHGHPVLHAGDHRRDGAAGRRPGRVVAAVRHLRRGAVDE